MLLCWVVGEIEWELVLVLVLASQIVKLLPRVEEEVVDGADRWKLDGPVYVIVPEVRRWGKFIEGVFMLCWR